MCYLVNKSLPLVLDDKTPHEVWNFKKPSLKHIKVFGYDVYVHISNENRTKMDSKVEKCIFIGYKDGLKCYKLWNLETKKVAYSPDMIFRENKYCEMGIHTKGESTRKNRVTIKGWQIKLYRRTRIRRRRRTTYFRT